MKKYIKKFARVFNDLFFRKPELQLYSRTKYVAEINFWKQTLKDYVKWYKGELQELYMEKSPDENEKVKLANLEYSAILTWQFSHQQVKYLEDLKLSDDSFEGGKLLDVGSGPHPSALCFKNCEVYCLDPLLPLYMEAGFPIHVYDSRARFVYGFSEKMPFEDSFFDSVISVNALDHVDDFPVTANEIRRVLKPGGKIRLHLHFHNKTVTEPLELNDSIVKEAFRWCEGFRKIDESKSKRGYLLLKENEIYTLWSNF